MSFYKILSKYYDEVFKLQQATVHFLSEELNEKDVVLDMACSTFSYGLELTKKGIEVLGIDLNNSILSYIQLSAIYLNGIKLNKSTITCTITTIPIIIVKANCSEKCF